MLLMSLMKLEPQPYVLRQSSLAALVRLVHLAHLGGNLELLELLAKQRRTAGSAVLIVQKMLTCAKGAYRLFPATFAHLVGPIIQRTAWLAYGNKYLIFVGIGRGSVTSHTRFATS